MNVDRKVNCLNSQTKILICMTLKNKTLSLRQIVENIEREIGKRQNRETIYRSLESLRQLNIVDKKYLPEDKKIKYSLNVKKIEIDFIKGSISFLNKKKP